MVDVDLFVDLFEYQKIDVTDQGLGEAARRRLSGIDTGTVSFPGLPRFEVSCLAVNHLFPDSSIGKVEVLNTHHLRTLRNVIVGHQRGAARWDAVIDDACTKYDKLLIARDEAVRQLTPYPYDKHVAERIDNLLSILNELMRIRASYGNGSTQLTQFLNLYFIGNRALFTDVSESNIRFFRNELTFPDPQEPTRSLVCSWHGKIRTELPYRIHFEWPVPASQTVLKVVYIGPKITRS